MTETQPEPATTPDPEQPSPAPPAEAAAAKGKAGVADGIKSWSDAATAMFKAVLLAMAIVLVGAVSGTAIWRHLHSRVLVVDVSSEAEKTLKALGADIDLRFALRDALNERVAGVQQIVAVQGLSFASDSADADAVSFKPFGLELSTDDITRIVDLVFDRPPRPTVRLELLCAPVACTDPAAHRATLVVNLSGPSGSRSATYPIALDSRGLGRRLHQSVARIADLVLEQNEPLIASVLFLNRPVIQAVLPDQYLPDLIRAEGAAVAGRKSGDADCLADLVIGGSLVDRGELAGGVAAEKRAAEAANVVCKVHANTNIVFFLFTFALCNPIASVRHFAHEQVGQALARLDALGIRRGAMDDQVYFRIPTADLTASIMRVMEISGGAAKPTVCLYEHAPQTVAGNKTAQQLQALLVEAQAMLPTGAHTLMQHEVLDLFWRAMQAGVPRGDLPGRLALGRALTDTIRRIQIDDPHPRTVFVLQGKVAMDIAGAAFAALDRKPPDPGEQSGLVPLLEHDAVIAHPEPYMVLADAVDRNLSAAAVAFQNALATSASAPLVEPASDVEVLGMLADAWYVQGQLALARTTYARAVDGFIEAGEPVEQVFAVSGALARWATVLIDAGGCENDPHTDPAWAARWALLGDTPPDVCRLGKPDDTAAAPPLLASIQKLIRHAIAECYQPLPQDAGKNMLAVFSRRFDMIDCHNNKGVNDVSMRLQLTAEAIDAEIGRALAAQH